MSGSPDTADPAADLLSAVAQAYGLTAPFHAKRLSGGYANDVSSWMVSGPSFCTSSIRRSTSTA
jgi:hypothetical protein